MPRFFRSPRAREDPAVAAVERILGAAAPRELGATQPRSGRPVVSVALWICACVSCDDAPTWLIYASPQSGVAWRRVPDGVEPLDLVDARLSAGGHADPAEVLQWLRWEASDPWSGTGDGGGDLEVLDELLLEIRDHAKDE